MRNILIPYVYRVRSAYRTDKYYKSTFTALVATAIAAGIIGYLTYLVKTKEADYEKKEARIEAEKKTIDVHSHNLANTIYGYSQIQKWAPHRRVACAPMLDWVEKHVPPESALTGLTIDLAPFTPGVLRKGTLGLDIYLDPSGGTNVANATAWTTIAGTSQEFTSSGIEAGAAKISKAKPMGQGMMVHVDIPFTQKKDL